MYFRLHLFLYRITCRGGFAGAPKLYSSHIFFLAVAAICCSVWRQQHPVQILQFGIRYMKRESAKA